MSQRFYTNNAWLNMYSSHGAPQRLNLSYDLLSGVCVLILRCQVSGGSMGKQVFVFTGGFLIQMCVRLVT
jgi:hypothetical protein